MDTFRAVLIDIPGKPEPVPSIIDPSGSQFVGFITEHRNAELAEAMTRSRQLATIWEWHDIPEGAVIR